jgi:hypothetical protein
MFVFCWNTNGGSDGNLPLVTTRNVKWHLIASWKRAGQFQSIPYL